MAIGVRKETALLVTGHRGTRVTVVSLGEDFFVEMCVITNAMGNGAAAHKRLGAEMLLFIRLALASDVQA